MRISEKIILSLFIFLLIPFACGVCFVALNINVPYYPASVSNTVTVSQVKEVVQTNEDLLPEKLSNPPQIINAIYVTGWSAGSSSYFKYLEKVFNTTVINAVVIDIKDYSGMISYRAEIPELSHYNLYSGAIRDINGLVNKLHEKGVYVIGRISVFEDPAYSKARPELAVFDKSKTSFSLWYDNHRLSWVDPGSKESWDYNISLAKDAFNRGFDEINFDYIRFPSDGKTKNMGFPSWDGKVEKREVIRQFLKYAREKLSGEKISLDLFGQTTVNRDDMGIGQVIEDGFDYSDYVSPMVYPSHYIKGFLGFDNPADHPYEIVKNSMLTALIRQAENQNSKIVTVLQEDNLVASGAKLRPWIQDFNMGAVYDIEKVSLEIKAIKDALGEKYAGFMLWNPSNIYTLKAIPKDDLQTY